MYCTVLYCTVLYLATLKQKFGFSIGPNTNNHPRPSEADPEDDEEPTKINTTPFADDFNLISTNKKNHQKVILDIQSKLVSMGLKIKPQKCRSISIQRGKITKTEFSINNTEGNEVNIASILDKPLKFLGSLVTPSNSPEDMFNHVYDKLQSKLTNITLSKIRGELKIQIYKRYLLPSVRFHLMVHEFHTSHLEKLDTLARKHLKLWLNLPPKGVSDISLFHPNILGLQTPSALYHEAHALSYATMRTKADSGVQTVLNSKLKREKMWKKKSSTIVNSDRILQKSIPDSPEMECTPHPESVVSQGLVKKQIKKTLKEETLEHWKNKVGKLVHQGDLVASILQEEQEDITWKSIIFNVPKNIMAFALRAASNSLASPDNLKRWGISRLGRCNLCQNKGTLLHLLNFCSVSLSQGRYTWRHDSVLQTLVSHISPLLLPSSSLLSDLPDSTLGYTIPPNILLTSHRPDLVIFNMERKIISILKLTVSFETNTEEANLRKMKKYLPLQSDLEDLGFTVTLCPFEIGSRGFINKRNRGSISSTLNTHIASTHKEMNGLFKNLAKVALSTSSSPCCE